MTFRKNVPKRVEARLRKFEGRLFVDLRVCWKADNGVWGKTTNGLCLSADLLPELEAAVTALRETVDFDMSSEGEADDVSDFGCLLCPDAGDPTVEASKLSHSEV